MAEAPRNRLPSGFDENFVNAVEDDFECLICHLAMKEPVLTRCGHRFGKECLEEHFRRQGVQGQSLTCPADREILEQDRDVFPDKATERKILSLVIKCPNEGCDWTGELRNKEIHLASCLFKLVSCTNENCHVTVQRKDLEQHATITCQWRIIKCEHCGESHPHCQMQDHIAQCTKFPVHCPNNCNDSIPREMIPNHIENDCQLTIISCPYVQMGCETEVQRKEVEFHLRSAVRFHLNLACETTRNLMEKLNTLETRFEKKLIEDQEKKMMVKKLETSDLPRMFLWKINNFRESLRQAKMEENYDIQSDPFYTLSYGYKLRVQIYPNGTASAKNTHLSVYINVMKGEYDAILPWPFKKKVKLTLIDQQEDPAKRENVTDQLIPDNDPECYARPVEEGNTGYGFPEFISHKELLSRRYLVDDTLFLQVEVGQPSSLLF